MESLEYRPLKKEENEFRVLTILADEDKSALLCCTLDTCSLADPPQFYALSFVWTVTTNIIVNGSVFPATVNLEQALRMLRSQLKNASDIRPIAAVGEASTLSNPATIETTSELSIELQLSKSNQFRIWVDAVCINQADIAERNDQILRMRDIYSKSIATIAWLGPPAGQSDESFNLIHLLSSRKPQEVYNEVMVMTGENNYRHLWVPLANLLSRDYWTRCWILQEIVLAKQVWFFCGKASADLETLLMALFGNKFEHEAALERYGYREVAGQIAHTYVAKSTMLKLCLKLQLKKKACALDPVEVPEFRERERREQATRSAQHPPTVKFDLRSIQGRVGLPYILFEKSQGRLQSTNINDQVFSLLGLTDDAAALVPDPKYETPFRTVMKKIYQNVIQNTQTLDWSCLSSGNESFDPRTSESISSGGTSGVSQKNESGCRRGTSHYEEIQRERAAGLWPSWVPDHCKPYGNTFAIRVLETPIEKFEKFHATRGQRPQIHIIDHILSCLGVIFDTIMSPTYDSGSRNSCTTNSASTQTQPSAQPPNPYSTPAATYKAICHSATLYPFYCVGLECHPTDHDWAFAEFWNATWQGVPDDRQHLYPPLSAFDLESLDPSSCARRWGLLHDQKDMTVHGLPLREWVRRRTWEWSVSLERRATGLEEHAGVWELVSDEDLSNPDGSTLGLIANLNAMGLGHYMAPMLPQLLETHKRVRSLNTSAELYVTEKGYIGSRCKYFTKEAMNDKIALLFGCSVPVILRQRVGKDGYDFIGETYVHGIMNGEALQGISQDEVKWINIY